MLNGILFNLKISKQILTFLLVFYPHKDNLLIKVIDFLMALNRSNVQVNFYFYMIFSYNNIWLFFLMTKSEWFLLHLKKKKFIESKIKTTSTNFQINKTKFIRLAFFPLKRIFNLNSEILCVFFLSLFNNWKFKKNLLPIMKSENLNIKKKS